MVQQVIIFQGKIWLFNLHLLQRGISIYTEIKESVLQHNFTIQNQTNVQGHIPEFNNTSTNTELYSKFLSLEL